MARGAVVVNVDKLTYAGNLESLHEVSDEPRYHFEHADISDAAEIRHIFDEHRPRAVMHLAAESHVDRSIDGPADFIHTNLVGTFTLLDAARRHCRQLERRSVLSRLSGRAFRQHGSGAGDSGGQRQHRRLSRVPSRAPS